MSSSRRYTFPAIAAAAALVAVSVVVYVVGGSDDDDTSAPLPSEPASSVQVTGTTGPTTTTTATRPPPPPFVGSGELVATVHDGAWRLDVTNRDRASVLASVAGGGIVVTTPDGVARSTNIESTRASGDGIVATVATDRDSRLRVRIHPAGEGVLAVAISAKGSKVERVALDLRARRGERFFGFGERSNAVEHRGRTVENRALDGPYRTDQLDVVSGLVPEPGFSRRRDATYFPVPWVLSSRGYGLLVDNDHASRFELAVPERTDRWRTEVDASSLRLRIFAGPTPAEALERMTAAIGRQPAASTPAVFGPWWQASDDGDTELAALREAGVPMSVAQTYTHYLPCGDHRGRRDDERARTTRLHRAGLAVTTYLNPMVCTGFPTVYRRGVADGAFTQTRRGEPYRYRYSTATQFDVAQFDFSTPVGSRLFGDVVKLTVADGYDGWMEDFGEYTPTDAVSADGTPGDEMHNRYVEQYHASAASAAGSARRPIIRFNRSGWTGAIEHSQVVWGGDPTATWGFDGLRSSVLAGLGMGMSGVSTWGSDIGGFFIWFDDQLTPELLRRWIQFGAFSGVMRLQAGGIELGQAPRATILDPEVLPTWRRYARLRTQLYPYIAGADEHYRSTGLPIMRQHLLTHPDDRAAVASDDQYLFGADLLVAPVMRPGARRRSVYLPEGEWIDLWRSTSMDRDGTLHLRRTELRDGGRRVDVAAPADEVPIHIRSGAVLPMLPADVDTLSGYGRGNPDVVRLADRQDERRLLAFPGPDWSGALGPGESMSSSVDGDRWTLTLRPSRPRTYQLEATLTRLGGGGDVCSVTAAGSSVGFTTDDGVLSTQFAIDGDGERDIDVVVRRCD